MYYAHSTKNPTRHDWQLLSVIETAETAERFGEPIGTAKPARLAGLLHDLGKYTRAFQARLAGADERVDHSIAGAAIVKRLATTAKPMTALLPN